MDVGWMQPFNECRGDGDMGWRWVDRTKVIGHVWDGWEREVTSWPNVEW